MPSNAHGAQFYASPRILHGAIAKYFSASRLDRGGAVMVARPATFDGVVELMEAIFGIGRADIQQRITFVDVHDVLNGFMHGGIPDPLKVRAGLAGLIGRVSKAATDDACWVYGEMADVLCAQRNYTAALQLERLWNGMAHEWPKARVLCGYAADSFHGSPMRAVFRDVCDEHSHILNASAVGLADAPIYLVDDDPGIRFAMTRLLGSFGYHVDSFGSAEEFLDTVDWPARGCLILDVQLPGINGPELQGLLADRASELAVIAVSASRDPAVEAEVLRRGATVFLRKPLDANALVAAVKDAMKIM